MLKLRNLEEFSREVEKLVLEKKLTYLEAVIEHSTKSGIDVDNTKIKNLLSPKIQEKIYNEAIEYNMIRRGKKRKKLPI